MRCVDEVDEGGETIADQQFHHQSAQYQTTSRFELVGVKPPPHNLAHLGEEWLRPLNGTTDDLGKKGRKQEEHNRVTLNQFIVPVDFNEIRDEFERVVGDTERQQQAAPGSRCLKDNNDADDQRDANGHVGLFRPFADALCDRKPYGVHARRGEDEQHEIDAA